LLVEVISMNRHLLLSISLALLLTAGCSAPAGPAAPGSGLSPGEKPQVVATTSIVADVVAQVGGDLIDLGVLIPIGADPHAFEPTPQDVVAVSDAHILFANGAGLEEFLDPMLESAGAAARVVYVSDGVDLRHSAAEADPDHEEAADDPHTWTDPNNVMVWVGNIEEALVALDPPHADRYRANAAAYRAELAELDGWIRGEIALIPEANRRVATDHATLNYFADRYGVETVGAIIPGYSSLSEPSARELAVIEDTIRDLQVKAVLVGNTVNPALSERVAQDTGTQLVRIYTGSLSSPGGEADSYVAYLHYNVNAIVEALR
jgi:ABC-type Zn uptake system ZnuABC Zn-binding protein ZnuA